LGGCLDFAILFTVGHHYNEGTSIILGLSMRGAAMIPPSSPF